VKLIANEYEMGTKDRVLPLSGAQHAVAKATGFLARILVNEPLNARSTSRSNPCHLRLLVSDDVAKLFKVKIAKVKRASGSVLRILDEVFLPLRNVPFYYQDFPKGSTLQPTIF